MNLNHNPTIGVLALQGGWRPHADVLSQLGVVVRYVRTPLDLTNIDGLIVPGGESTAISIAICRAHMWHPLRQVIRDDKLPVFGTCAGAILLAGDLGGSSCTIQRNAYGAQNESFVEVVGVQGIGEVDAFFIRAPKIMNPGRCTVMARRAGGEPVLLQEDNMTLCTFHPELASHAIHAWFVENVIRHAKRRLENQTV